MAKRVLFTEITLTGERVVLTRDRWREIVRFKHPALAEHEAEVRECIRDPAIIRTSEKDPTVHLYYRLTATTYILRRRRRRGAEVALRDHGILYQTTQEGAGSMDKVRIYHDRTGNTLTVWFDDPKKEVVCEEVQDDVLLIKDKRGRVIGFERLNYLTRKQQGNGATIPVEVQVS